MDISVLVIEYYPIREVCLLYIIMIFISGYKLFKIYLYFLNYFIVVQLQLSALPPTTPPTPANPPSLPPLLPPSPLVLS